MRQVWSVLTSRMGRRGLALVGAAMAVVLILAVGLIAVETGSQQELHRQQALDRAASEFAAAIGARLAAADEIAAALVAADAGSGGQLLRERSKSAAAFRGVLLLSANATSAGRTGAYDISLSRAQLGTVLSGGSALISVHNDSTSTLYLSRLVSVAGAMRVAAFEITPEWLWSPLDDLPNGLSLVAVDSLGALVHGGNEAALPPATLASDPAGTAHPGDVRHRAWQANGIAWDGSAVGVHLARAPTSPPLNLMVASPRPSFWNRIDAIFAELPTIALMAVALSLATVFLLYRRTVSSLQGVSAALGSLREQHAAQLPLPALEDEVRELVDAYNRAATFIDQQFATLRARSEIDSLLLGAADLETVIDQLLVRLRALMCARAVGITLIDADAVGYGRLFVASAEDSAWPVRRVALDESLVDLFATAPDGLTIARCEEERHSFLIPLTQIGAQFFWAWPIMANDRLAAILSVGYCEAPRLGASLAGHGTDCARRLGTVLSRGARAEHLYRQAHYDTLTQLPNRLLFQDRLEQALNAAMAIASRGALLYIDLDHFKKVNDTLGHAAGDQLLMIVAQRLRSCIKDGDTVARLAGDEFTVVLHQISDPDDAMQVAKRITESLGLPVNLAGKDHHVKASIGITVFPDDGVHIDDLMRNADMAMYRAKDQGRGTATFFDRKMMGRDLRVPDTGLYRALKRREFSLYYQPQFMLQDGSMTAVEALLRWDSPRGGMRSPAEFVPAAEECGLIVDIGGWVLEAACAQFASWRQQGLTVPRLTVNISLHQLYDSGLVSLVRRLLDKYSLPPNVLELELTEAAFADQEAESALQGLGRLGVRLALDDFGTGVTALNHLRRYPVKTVKIDRSFVDDVAENPASATLAQAIIAMAHTLGQQVVAEGVETVEQLEFLRERRCDAVQGYYLARPLSAAGMSELLAARNPAVDDNFTAQAG